MLYVVEVNVKYHHIPIHKQISKCTKGKNQPQPIATKKENQFFSKPQC